MLYGGYGRCEGRGDLTLSLSFRGGPPATIAEPGAAKQVFTMALMAMKKSGKICMVARSSIHTFVGS